MHRFRSILAIFIILLMAGCGKPKVKGADVVVWHWMTDRDSAFLALAEKYNKEKGVDVKFELYAPSEAYSSKIRAAAQTNALPEVFGVMAEKRDFAAYIKAGHISNLTGYMDAQDGAWKKSLFEKPLAMNAFLPGNEFGVDPGIYGVPIDVTNILFLYNKDLFKKAGLDPENPPKTWPEFLAAGKKLKAAGIPGLVSGWGEIWMIDCLASNFAFNVMGEEKVIETIRGNVPYTDPDWVRVFTLFKEMKDNSLLASGIVTMVNKTAELIFANEQAALAFNGSWCVNVYNGMNPKLNYGVMLPPVVNSQHPMIIWGGAGSSFVVNEKSPNKEQAVEFLKWLTAPEQQAFLAIETKNLPSNKNSLSSIPPILAEFAKHMDNTTHPNTFPVSEYPLVIEAFDKGIQGILIGEKTPEQIAQEVEAMKQKQKKAAQQSQN